MTIWKTIYNFYQFLLEFRLLKLFNSVCKDLSTNLRRFGLSEGPQQLFFILFPQESLFRDAGHSVHSSVLVVETNCPLQIIRQLSTFDNNFATDGLLENV